MKNFFVKIDTTAHMVDVKVTGDFLISGLPSDPFPRHEYETKTTRTLIKRKYITGIEHYDNFIVINVDETRGLSRLVFDKDTTESFRFNGKEYKGKWTDLVSDLSDLVNEP